MLIIFDYNMYQIVSCNIHRCEYFIKVSTGEKGTEEKEKSEPPKDDKKQGIFECPCLSCCPLVC